jgi:hypothetical protein
VPGNAEGYQLKKVDSARVINIGGNITNYVFIVGKD